MREIEFRGRALEDEKFLNIRKDDWIFGNYSYDKLTDKYYIEDTAEEDIKTIEVASNTIGQYSGQTDKIGTKIFEGDIVRILRNSISVFAAKKDELAIVEFGDRFCQFELNYFNKEWADNECLGNFRNGDCEVIGNIYDNPELLKVAD